MTNIHAGPNQFFEIARTPTYAAITLKSALTKEDAADLEKSLSVPQFLSLPWVFNCSGLPRLSPIECRFLLSLKKKNTSIAILTAPKLSRMLHEVGLDEAFQQATTLKQALAFFGINYQPQINVEIVNLFLASALRVLKSQTGLEIQLGKPKLPDGPITFDVTGISTFSSPKLNGVVALGFSRKTLLPLLSLTSGDMTGPPEYQIQSFMLNIMNTIYETAKPALAEKGHVVGSMVPVVLQGLDHAIPMAVNQTTIVVPAVEKKAGPFSLIIGINH